MAILVDTSALLADAFRKDSNHRQASDFFRQQSNEPQLVPVPLLTELFYMTTVCINDARAVQVFATTQLLFK
jgi:predicted nucleic acid-binding protein